jgi:hypothetical protein
VIFPGFLRLNRRPLRFSIDEPASQLSPETRKEDGPAFCAQSTYNARFSTRRLRGVVVFAAL